MLESVNDHMLAKPYKDLLWQYFEYLRSGTIVRTHHRDPRERYLVGRQRVDELTMRRAPYSRLDRKKTRRSRRRQTTAVTEQTDGCGCSADETRTRSKHSWRTTPSGNWTSAAHGPAVDPKGRRSS